MEQTGGLAGETKRGALKAAPTAKKEFIFTGTDPPWRAVFHLETVANLLILLERVSTVFSKCDLKSLKNQADFDSAIRRFDPSRPSHAVTQLRIVYAYIAKSLQNRGFFAFLAVSPSYQNRQLMREIVESLRPSPAIFPFLRDFERRLFRSALRARGGS